MLTRQTDIDNMGLVTWEQGEAGAIAMTTVQTIRVIRRLRDMGFRRYHRSSSGSRYYQHDETGIRVRVSDHEVPYTAAREHDGGWAVGWNVIIGEDAEIDDVARELVHIRRDVRRNQKLAARR